MGLHPIPANLDEWQDAVDSAHVLLLIDSARKYGLVTGGPEADIERCEQMIRDGRARGVVPRPDAVERLIHA